MQKTTTGVFIAIIVIVLIAGAVLYTSKKDEPQNPTPREEAQEEAVRPTQTINVKHQYKDGTHVFAGTVETPTPCYDIEAVVLPGDVPEIHITTKQQEGVEMCAQVVSEKSFKVSYTAPESTQFLATVNDEPVNMNQFDIDADVDIDTVEILLKG